MTATLRMRRGGLELAGATRIVGILNVTPDSFSDGGRHLELEAAVAAGLRMEDEGAAMIDVGGVSTRPGSRPPEEDEERRRVLPVVEALAGRLDIPVSVDTWRAAVFREAWEAGAEVLNDVTALRGDPEMIPVLSDTGAPAVLMHMKGEPATMQSRPRYRDVVEEVKAFFLERLGVAEAAGLPRDRFVLDPGIGFGKTLEHNLELLRRVAEFKGLGLPLLYGTSRKGFLGRILDRSEPAGREWGTAATTAHLRGAGVELLRVHDVRAAVDVVRVLERIANPSTGNDPA